MRLKSLEIQGFKSFPDKTRLDFGEGITAVVGPNGSGKSNIADAVRWVLGEQSTKTLRGASMADVIFDGTQGRKAVGYAIVSLVIDNSDNVLADSDKELVISRRLYRSGESEYRIGQNLVRLRDIHELFMDTGLGRDGYSIIGQGRIAEIVSAKSNQRREIFEEAAGISKFRYRRAEAERRLAQAQENLLRLQDIAVELESRVEPLKRQSEKAAEFLKLSEERRGLEVSLWNLSLTELKVRLAEQENKVLICRNDYEHLENESGAIEQNIAEIYREMQQLSVNAEEKRATIRELEDRLAKSVAQVAVWQNDIGHNEQTVERLQQEISSFDITGREVVAELEKKKAEHENIKTEIERLQTRAEAAKQRLTEQREQRERLDQEISGLQVRKGSLENATSELRLEQAANSSIMLESASRLEALRSSSNTHNHAVKEAEKNIAECKNQIRETEEQISSLQNSQQGYALKRQSRDKRRRELDEKIIQLADNAHKYDSRVKLLEDLEANMEGYPNSVRYILSESKRGALPGVFGTVSSLISTKQKYITAIETAFGAAMQNIVVEYENIAKRAMRMLQSGGKGRATFLPLTSFSGREMDIRQLEGYSAFIGVASSLVECDDKFRGIIARILGRVAVVEDLDSATEIARSTKFQFRIVTLDGQVINSGGSFTGGSTAKTAGVLSRKNEIEHLRIQADEFIKQKDELEPQNKAILQELSSLDAALSGIAGELQSKHDEKTRLGFMLLQLEKTLEIENENCLLSERELENLQQRLQQIEQGETDSAQILEELLAQSSKLEAEITSAQNRRQALSVGIENMAQSLNEQNMAELAASKDADIFAAEIERLHDQLENADVRVQSLHEEHKNVLTKNDEICALIETQGSEKQHLTEQVEVAQNEIKALLEKRTTCESQTTKLRQQEREVSAKREDISRELARLEERRTSMQQEYDAIIANLWDTYEMTRSQAAELAQPLDDPLHAKRRLAELRNKIRALGTVNVEAIDEYKEVYERYTFLTAQIKDVVDARERLLTLINELTEEMRTIFRENFHNIAVQFSKIFVQLFGGGSGELSLTDENDVLESGIDINVQPPGKAVKNISLLSGGEQALIAIAIYFAILKVKPAPFCLLDEIEAALDDINVVRFASYLRQMCNKTQFIAITHRRGTMEEADMLYGVTMQEEGVSKLLELRVSEVETRFGAKI